MEGLRSLESFLGDFSTISTDYLRADFLISEDIFLFSIDFLPSELFLSGDILSFETFLTFSTDDFLDEFLRDILFF